MSNQTGHHGRHSFEGKNKLCSLNHYQEEKIGKFGRMFRDLPPLYLSPNTINKLGAVDGPMNGGDSAELTNNVPLGQIFLGQFIDHDITLDVSSSFSNINNPTEHQNLRTPKLDLDCIFGTGPEGSPYLYRKNHLYLLTGATNKNVGQPLLIRKHDLARNGEKIAMIGDPRNDENRVISQLQLAFIRFYNHVYKKLLDEGFGSAEQIHHEARKLVTWHYQWIIVNEFLPSLCGEKIVKEVLSNGRSFYCPSSEAFIPVEFSVAAYRFGHSMIAQNMKLKQSGPTHNLFSTEFGAGFKEIINLNQVIEWEVFFDFDGSFQRAEKLDTTLATDLLDLVFIPSPKAVDRSLATRNLRRGQSFLLPSGENVAKKLGIDEDVITDVKNLIYNKTSSFDIDLSEGTPLWYYILAEAEEIGRINSNGTTTPGEGLGPVGARIVTEVIIGLLELDTDSYLGSNRDWLPSLGTGSEFTMKDLLELSATAIDL